MFGSKKKPIQETIEFNKQRLHEEAGRIGDRLHAFKEDEGAQSILKIISLWRNAAVLDVAMARNETELITFKARLSCFDDMRLALERDLNKTVKEAKDEKPTGTIKMFRRTNNQAGTSI